jgi:hypothetical protein
VSPFTKFGFGDNLPEGHRPEPPTHKLIVELVPSTSWGANLRRELPPSDWDVLRKRAYRLAGHRCEICGGKGSKHPVECHEVWDYNDETHVQTLVRLITLCPPCHEVKHFGLAQVRGYEERAFNHLMRVNNWPPHKGLAHLEEAFAQWHRRSQHDWTLDLSWLEANGVDIPVPRDEFSQEGDWEDV